MLKCKSLLRYLTLIGIFSCILIQHPQANARVEIHGFVRLDYQWMDRIPLRGLEIPITSAAVPFPLANQVPFDNDEPQEHSQFLMDARFSRIGIQLIDEACGVTMLGRLVADFYTDDGEGVFSNGRHFRMRWASMRANFTPNWFFIIGQENTNFGDYDIVVPTGYAFVEANAWSGIWEGRHPMALIGYQQDLLYDCEYGVGKLQITLAAERHGLYRERDELIFLAKDPVQGAGFLWPLFVGRIGWYGWLPFQADVGFATTQNRIIGNANLHGIVNGKIYKTKSVPWAFQVSARTEWGPLAFFGHAQWFNGLNHLSFSFPDCVFDANLRLRNVRSWGWFVGTTYNFNCERTYISAIYGRERAHEIPGSTFSGISMGRDSCYIVNLYHKFWFNDADGTHWETGIEFKRWDVENFNGIKGHLDIIQGCTMYFF